MAERRSTVVHCSGGSNEFHSSITFSYLVKNRCPPGSTRQSPLLGVRAKPPTFPDASYTRGVTPLFTSSRAAVSPAGPAPMINGFRICGIHGLPPAELRGATEVRHELVYLATHSGH